MRKMIQWVMVAIASVLAAVLSTQVFAQSPAPAPPAAVEVAPLPGSATTLPPSPSPTASPVVSITPRPGVSPSPPPSPTASPTPPVPGLPVPIAIPSPPPLAPVVPAAPPLPTAGEYKDGAGQFRVATLKGFAITPMAGTFMAESTDGSLAYTVLSQQLSGTAAFNDDYLVELAKSAFGRGEGFQMGLRQLFPGGLKMDWTGSLTIGGQTQPMNGVILVKTGGLNRALLLLIAATEAGTEKVPGALSALSDSLQPI
jgi:hypothetical protein